MASSQPAAATKDREKRFEELLKPIRDLAQNWNIDVARDLEEYLEDLEHIQITFDGGKTSLNFAEAALLIQGSACVYSRKVEYLYALIYHALDVLHARAKKGKKRMAAALAAGDADADALEEAEEEFLLLDDAIKEGSRAAITLKENPVDLATSLNMSMTYVGPQKHAGAQTPPHASWQRRVAADVLAHTPLAVMAANRFERRESGYRIASLTVGKGGSLLLDAAPLGGRAAGAVASLLDLSLPPIDPHASAHASFINLSGEVQAAATQPADVAAAANANILGDTGDDLDEADAYAMYGWDDAHEPAYVPEPAAQQLDEEAHGTASAVAATAEPVHANVATAAATTRATRASTAGTAARAHASAASEPPRVTVDPWTQLDPFADGVVSAKKPFRKARTYLVLKDPSRVSSDGPLAAAAEAMSKAAASGGRGNMHARGLAARASALVARAAALQPVSSMLASAARAPGSMSGTSTALGMALTAMAAKAQLHAVPAGDAKMGDPSTQRAVSAGTSSSILANTSIIDHFTTPVFSELDGVVKRQKAAASRARLANRRLRAAREPTAVAAGAAYDLGHHDVEDDNDGGFGSAFHGGLPEVDNGAGDVEIGGAYETGPTEQDGAPDGSAEPPTGTGIQPVSLFGVLEDASAVDPFDTESGAEAGPRASLSSAFSQDADGAAYARAVQKYMNHINTFIKDAGAAAHESALSKRVTDWQDKLLPVLDEEDKRREFDIHAYGHQIVDTLVHKTHATAPEVGGEDMATDVESEPTFTFAQVVPAPERYEVCRTFLAMLQLANMGNVEIVQADASPEVPSSQEASSARRAASLFASSQFEAVPPSAAGPPFQVRLLSSHTGRKSLDEYVAPSAQASITTTGHVGEGYTGPAAHDEQEGASVAPAAGSKRRENREGASRGAKRSERHVKSLHSDDEAELDDGATSPTNSAPETILPAAAGPDVTSPGAKRGRPAAPGDSPRVTRRALATASVNADMGAGRRPAGRKGKHAGGSGPRQRAAEIADAL